MKVSRRSATQLLLGSLASLPLLGASAQTGEGRPEHANGVKPEPGEPLGSGNLTNFPKGYTPREVGKALSEHFVPSAHYHEDRIVYPEVCAWYGALEFARLTNDAELIAKLKDRFDPLMAEPGSKLLPPQGTHVDFSMFGCLPLELYIITKDRKYLDLGLQYADKQWAKPDANGLTGETRFWIDDMYMITIVQVQAFRATQDGKYLDRAATELSAYLDKLQQPNGLFYHAPDVPFFWGRGNGWFAVGMTELLRDLPKDHPRYPRILKGYRTMMESLLRYQAKDGTWRQLIDRPESWAESSGTGMFSFSLITGVKRGWLEPTKYAPAARAAWLGLAGYIDQYSNVTSVCEGTNKLNDLQYYLLRRRRTGDFHGQSPVLWSVAALLRA